MKKLLPSQWLSLGPFINSRDCLVLSAVLGLLKVKLSECLIVLGDSILGECI
jgi:hypothetical protein